MFDLCLHEEEPVDISEPGIGKEELEVLFDHLEESIGEIETRMERVENGVRTLLKMIKLLVEER